MYVIVSKDWLDAVHQFIDEYGFDELPFQVKVVLGYKWDIETKEWYLETEGET